MCLNQFHTVCLKIETKFLGKQKFQTFFQPKNRWSPKKKKKKRSSPKLSLIFRPKSEIQTIFQPQNRWTPKKKVFTKFESDFSAKFGNSNNFAAQKQVVSKKKRSSPKLSLIFRPKSHIQTLFHTESRHLLHNFGTQFLLGGAVFNFSPKIGLKSNKNVQFCIPHKPTGRLEPPRPPGSATVQDIYYITIFLHGTQKYFLVSRLS